MKWLGTGEGDGIIKVEMDRGQHRSQDDAAVGYVFQRPPDPDFNSFGPKQLRWAPGDDSIIENHDKWKYPPPPPSQQQQQQPHIPGGMPKMPCEPPPSLGGGSYMAVNPYEMAGLGGAKPEHLVYMGGMQYLGQPSGQLIAGGAQGQQMQPRLAQQQISET